LNKKKEDNKFFINAFHSSKSKNKSTIRGHKNSDFCLQLKERKDEKKHKKSRKDRMHIILNLLILEFTIVFFLYFLAKN